MRLARPRGSDQVAAGSRRPAHVRRMPSRSLQRLPARSLPRSPERSTPCRARRLAGRAGSRHGHPLPDKQGNKAEHTAGNRVVCRLPEDNGTENQSGCLVPHHTTRIRRQLGRCRAPGHPDSWPAVSWTRAPSVEQPTGLVRGILTRHRLADDCPHNSEGHVSVSDIVTGTHTDTSTRSVGAARVGHRQHARRRAQVVRQYDF